MGGRQGRRGGQGRLRFGIDAAEGWGSCLHHNARRGAFAAAGSIAFGLHEGDPSQGHYAGQGGIRHHLTRTARLGGGYG